MIHPTFFARPIRPEENRGKPSKGIAHESHEWKRMNGGQVRIPQFVLIGVIRGRTILLQEAGGETTMCHCCIIAALP